MTNRKLTVLTNEQVDLNEEKQLQGIHKICSYSVHTFKPLNEGIQFLASRSDQLVLAGRFGDAH